MFRAGLYARISTSPYVVCCPAWLDHRLQVREVGSRAAKREARERILEAARRRNITVVLEWRLHRWGRTVTDLLATLHGLDLISSAWVFNRRSTSRIDRAERFDPTRRGTGFFARANAHLAERCGSAFFNSLVIARTGLSSILFT